MLRLKILFPIIFLLINFYFAHSQSKSLNPTQQSLANEYVAKIENALNNNNKNEAAGFYVKLAFVYWEGDVYKEAIDNFNKALVINQEIGNQNAIKVINTNIGRIYQDMGNYDNAVTYLQKALQYNKKSGNKQEVGSNLYNIAINYVSLKKYNDAIANLEEAIKIGTELNDVKLLKSCYLSLSETYEKQGNAEKSLYYFSLYSSFQKQLTKEEIKKKEEQLNEMENKTKQAEYEKLLKEQQLNEKISLLDSSEKKLFYQRKLSKEKQEEIDNLTKDQRIKDLEIEQKESSLKNARLLRNTLIGGLLLLLLFAIFIYRSYKQKQRTNIILAYQNDEIVLQRDEIENKNKELEGALVQIKEQNHNITSSINYAQRIQQAMLPSENNLKRFLPESFILFKPREIVSGDFYWFSDVNSNSILNQYQFNENEDNEDLDEIEIKKRINNEFIISAVDCTGHGVPGAFMSMIGFNLLNTIVSKGIVEADLILNELHKSIRLALKQYKNDNRDGMDIALCVINKERNKIEYAGAKNPLIYIQNNKITRIKADRKAIGGLQIVTKEPKREFTKNILEITEPTWCYIFSDGYADQFGGKENFKFMSENFENLLLQIHQKPMCEQKIILDKTIEEWKGAKNKQTDDILVIGFKLG